MLFSKKKADENLMVLFWTWFAENEADIAVRAESGDRELVWLVDAHLAPAFVCHKKEIEFMLGFRDGKGEFFFFDLKNKALYQDALRLGELMPASLRDRWTFIVEH